MTTTIWVRFGASVAGSWLAGFVGALLVWGFIYGIGARVVTDEIHYKLNAAVCHSGGLAGAAAALCVILLLRRPEPRVLVSMHILATSAGFTGGSYGWQSGLWFYFGTIVAFVVGVAAFVTCRFISANWRADNSAHDVGIQLK